MPKEHIPKHHKTIKNTLFALFLPALWILSLATCNSILAGEIINYSGNTTQLQNIPNYIHSSGTAIMPGTTAAPSNSDNTINFTKGTVTMVIGGAASSATSLETVENNTVTISGSPGTTKVQVFTYGGVSGAGAVNNNTLNISSGNFAQAVYGGYSFSGDASENIVRVTGGTFHANIYGAYTKGMAYANKVFIDGNRSFALPVYGGYSIGSNVSIYNEINIDSGTFTNLLVAGYATYGIAAGNIMNISGGTFNGSNNRNYAGYSTNKDTISNDLNIFGGTFGSTSWLVGGRSDGGDAYSNNVNLSGGTFSGYIYAGYSNTKSATDNMVTLNPGITLTDTAKIYGGRSGTSLTTNAFSGNTLDVRGYISGKADTISNFEIYKFTLPDSIVNSTALLHSKTFNFLNPKNPLDTSVVTQVYFEDDGELIAIGNRYILMEADPGLMPEYDSTLLLGNQGPLKQYQIMVYKLDDQVVAEIYGKQVDPGVEEIVAGQSAGIGAVTNGGDLVIRSGMQAMRLSLDECPQKASEPGYTTFAVTKGSRMRYRSTPRVDMDSISLLTGIAGKNQFGSAIFKAGPFLEAGWGSYDTKKRQQENTTTGNGNADYYGAGLMASAEFDQGFYLDTSVRGGSVKVDFATTTPNEYTNERLFYDKSSAYYAASIGAGKTIPLSEKSHLDISSHYLWSRIESKNIQIDQTPVHFDAVDSKRVVLGGQVHYQPKPSYSLYAGAAWDYEFDGKIHSSVDTLPVEVIDIGGGTGIGEIGLQFKPMDDKCLSLEVNLQGHVGQREGVLGGLRLNYTF